MSSIFELDDSGWDRMVADARNGNMATEADFQPGFSQGGLRGLGTGLMRGTVNTIDFLSTAGPDASSAPEFYDYDPAEQGLDPEVQKEAAQAFGEETRKKALDFWTPDPTSVGVLGRVLGGLGETAAPLVAGLGNPAVLAGTQTLAAGKHLVDEGVDSTTAGVTAATEGLATYAGFKLPILGKTLGQRIFTGAGGNLAVGMGGTFAEQKILEGRGYDELAEQYDPLDPEGRTIDLLMGAAFGGITHVGARMAASDRASVLAAANARHFQVDSAPGRPLDAHAAAAHVEAMKTALDQMERGEPVSVPQDVLEANFEPRPARAAPDPEVIRDVFGEDLPEPEQGGPMRFSRPSGDGEVSYVHLPDGRIRRTIRYDDGEVVVHDHVTDRNGDEHWVSAEQYSKGEYYPVQLHEKEAAQFIDEDRRGFGARQSGAEMSPTEGKLLEKPISELEQLTDIDENVKASLRQAYERAARVKPQFDQAVHDIAAEVGASERPLIPASLKAAARAAEKAVADYGGDANQVGDLVRATVVVDSIAQAQQAIEVATRRLGKPAKVKNSLSEGVEPLDGYRDINLKIEVGGQLVELQVNVPEMLEAKADAHKLYEERRTIQAKSEFTAEDDARITALDAQMRERYAAAWAAFLRRSNSSAEISTPSSRATLSEMGRPSGLSNAMTEKPPLAAGTVETGTPLTDQNTRSLPSGDIASSSDASVPEKQGEPAAVTKEFLKQNIDTRAVPDIQKMSKDPYAYVEKPAGSIEVPLKDIEFSKAEHVPDNALKRFAAAAAGEIPKREPPSVEALPNGRYKIVDGNGTVTALKAMGIDTIPVQVTQGAEQYGVRTVSTAVGRDLQVRPKLIELADAVTSDKANYPQELQPRQRGERVALSDQVRDIASKLNPSRLVDSAEADRGAPITGDGNIVESGNGRVMALKYAYENIPEKAAEYRKYLESQGYDTAGMKQPILVRERLTPLDDAGRRAFTVEANQAATATLSPVEMAQADARILDSAVLSNMRGGDMAKMQNAEFVRAFLQRLPVGERNDMLNADGSINQKGVRRLQAALLAKAYGGKEQSNATLARMLESTDEDMRSAMGALLDAAPAFARLRQAIADGKVSGDYDIAGQLTQAIENTARLRDTGQSLHDFLAQQDAFTERPPIVDDMMRMLYDKTGTRLASREKVAAKLTKYAGDASRQRLDQTSLFAEEPVAANKLVAGAAKEAEVPQPKVTDMFGLRTKQDTGTVPAVKQMLEREDVSVPTGAIDEDGNQVTRSGREVLAEAEAGIAKAEQDAKGVEAAVGCVLMRGLDDAA